MDLEKIPAEPVPDGQGFPVNRFGHPTHEFRERESARAHFWEHHVLNLEPTEYKELKDEQEE